jgi:hypothetical protein
MIEFLRPDFPEGTLISFKALFSKGWNICLLAPFARHEHSAFLQKLGGSPAIAG